MANFGLDKAKDLIKKSVEIKTGMFILVILCSYFIYLGYDTRPQSNSVQSCLLYNATTGCSGYLNGTQCCTVTLRYYQANQIVPTSNVSTGQVVIGCLIAVFLFMALSAREIEKQRYYLKEAFPIAYDYLDNQRGVPLSDGTVIGEHDEIIATAFGKEQRTENPETGEYMPTGLFTQFTIRKRDMPDQKMIVKVDPFSGETTSCFETEFDGCMPAGEPIADIIKFVVSEDVLKERRYRKAAGKFKKEGERR